MQVILLERIESLGNLGDEVRVKDGFARNYLLPQGKALRATTDNVAYFEKERKAIEANNAKQREAAAIEAKKVEGLTIDIIRQSSESGQLYGSVAARDISDGIAEKSGVKIARSQVQLNTNLKTLGLFPVVISLHPEVQAEITVNIARSAAEAETQRKTGKAASTGYDDSQTSSILEEEAIATEATEEAAS